jgi:hypothetical protein
MAAVLDGMIIITSIYITTHAHGGESEAFEGDNPVTFWYTNRAGEKRMGGGTRYAAMQCVISRG